MNCREFRRKHDGYVDDTLSGVEVDAMSNHLRVCKQCAQMDTRVRRALLVAHNLPPIQLSAAFAVRLQARLTQERALMGARRARDDVMYGGRWRPLSTSAYVMMTAGILCVAGLALTMTAAGREQETIRLAPVVATRLETEPSMLATPAMVASVPAGMSMWPAVFVAQQAPWHFAGDVAGR
jgi:Putative zinc-finger